MRKQIRIVFALFLIGIVSWISWAVLRPSEPHYDGKPLSFWLGAYLFSPEAEALKPEADKALSKMGTEAIPTLLRLLQAKDSKIKAKWLALLERLDKEYAFKFYHNSAWDKNWEGYMGFTRLGTNGAAAVPDLIKIYERNLSSESRSAVVFSLGSIGPSAKNAVPVLVKEVATETDGSSVIIALGDIHSDPNLVIPLLIDCLGDHRVFVRKDAAKSLGAFGADAKPAFHALLNLLQDKDAFVRKAVTNSLIKIDPVEAAKAGIK